ncbi:MAG: hypothetical protein Q7J54_01485 [Candidatus Woesearchaeota archaeon]|nr:hypothetical protein [Candidatus Woesearchaeota archaeon]
MKSNKKGMDMSVNVIIIAALALIVLVVLFAIFTGRLGGFSLAVQSCVDKGGECVKPNAAGTSADCAAEKSADWTILRGTDCEKDDNKDKKSDNFCCIPITK